MQNTAWAGARTTLAITASIIALFLGGLLGVLQVTEDISRRYAWATIFAFLSAVCLLVGAFLISVSKTRQLGTRVCFAGSAAMLPAWAVLSWTGRYSWANVRFLAVAGVPILVLVLLFVALTRENRPHEIV